jgi:rhodanese-related sulfurtransferase/transcriptional regulator with XRE-family HTH domain
VRQRSEWAAGHVPGARLVPLDELRSDPKAKLGGNRVLFVCAKGMRSLQAAEVAERLGVAEVYTLEGGTQAWSKAGLPIERPEATNRPKESSKPKESKESSKAREVAPTKKEPPAKEAAGCAVPDNLDGALNTVVAANVRELRARRNLSLDQLAKLSGISRSMLGQIELGKSVPSINLVWKLARTLNVPFATLISVPERTGTTLLRKSRAKRLTSADGRFSSRALFPVGEQSKVEFYELWLGAHASEEAEPHQPGTRENLIVTAGRLELQFGGEKHELSAGDAIVFAADVPHTYVNPGSEDCWMNLVMTYI